VAVVTTFGARRILNPVAELTAAARRMEGGRLEERVVRVGDDELGRLGHAFNSMAEALERSDGERRALTSDIAHELRTPLSNIRGYLEGIEDGVVESTPEVLATIHEEALLLQQLVDDLQTVALAEAGELRLHREPVDLAALAQQVVTTHRAQAQGTGVDLDLRVDAVPALALDPARMRQVLGNLIQNALRHTPRGGDVTVAVSAAGGAIELVVTDSGEGIAAEHLPHVFERFYRADSSRSRTTGGTGLGLAIVQQLVETQGGEVSIASTPGAGTAVTVRFPEGAARSR
jgi:two-component system sensor histidine kinase BaeS